MRRQRHLRGYWKRRSTRIAAPPGGTPPHRPAERTRYGLYQFVRARSSQLSTRPSQRANAAWHGKRTGQRRQAGRIGRTCRRARRRVPLRDNLARGADRGGAGNRERRAPSAKRAGEVPILYQEDPAWSNATYAGDSFGETGCGPTCMTMAYVALTGKTI